MNPLIKSIQSINPNPNWSKPVLLVQYPNLAVVIATSTGGPGSSLARPREKGSKHIRSSGAPQSTSCYTPTPLCNRPMHGTFSPSTTASTYRTHRLLPADWTHALRQSAASQQQHSKRSPRSPWLSLRSACLPTCSHSLLPTYIIIYTQSAADAGCWRSTDRPIDRPVAFFSQQAVPSDLGLQLAPASTTFTPAHCPPLPPLALLPPPSQQWTPAWIRGA